MFNDFYRQFELLNSRYERETQEILCFAKLHRSYGALRSKEMFCFGLKNLTKSKFKI